MGLSQFILVSQVSDSPISVKVQKLFQGVKYSHIPQNSFLPRCGPPSYSSQLQHLSYLASPASLQ